MWNPIEKFGIVFLLIWVVDSCAPPLAYGGSQDYFSQMSPQNALKILGDPIQANQGPITFDNKQMSSIKDPVDLFCYDFDEKCRWRNMEGLLIDELDWFQGSGFLDESKLRLATGTQNSPDGYYGIVATDKIHISSDKAVLVSDIVDCQMGPAELRFMYWTSPDVKIYVCTKTTDKIYPSYDYCSPAIETGDPGPAYVSIPDLRRKPFQIFIRAENFVMESNNLKGGFAIIDSLEYYGDLCSTGVGFFNNGVDFIPLTGPFHDQDTNISNVDSNSESAKLSRPISVGKEELIPLEKSSNPTITDPNSLDFVPLVARQKLIPTTTPLPFTTEKTKFVPVNSQACRVLNCTFTTEECMDYVRITDWEVTTGPVGNPATGIRGDASLLPYNKLGSYAYVSGPKLYSRLKTEPFEIEKEVNFMFAYYKVSKNAELKLVAKKESSRSEEILFEAPAATIKSKRWFRESRILTMGRYDYIAFDVYNLPGNAYIGVDELVILDSDQRPFCPAIKEQDYIRSFDGQRL